MGGSSSRTLDTVPRVDVPKLMGAWFVIATMPTPFEKGAHNAIETYTMGKGPHCVDVAFEYNKNAFDGKITSIPQRGSSWVSDNPAGWKVSPFWPLKMPYLVIDQSPEPLDDDNSWFVVGYPSRSYCWVMARRPEMDEKTYDGIASRLVETHGYPPGLPSMVKIPQAWARDTATKLGWKKKH